MIRIKQWIKKIWNKKMHKKEKKTEGHIIRKERENDNKNSCGSWPDTWLFIAGKRTNLKKKIKFIGPISKSANYVN